MKDFDVAPRLDDSPHTLPAQPDAVEEYLANVHHIGFYPDQPTKPRWLKRSPWIVIRPGHQLQSDDPNDQDILNWLNDPDREDNGDSYGHYPEYDRDSIHSGNGQISDEDWQNHVDGNAHPTK